MTPIREPQQAFGALARRRLRLRARSGLLRVRRAALRATHRPIPLWACAWTLALWVGLCALTLLAHMRPAALSLAPWLLTLWPPGARGPGPFTALALMGMPAFGTLMLISWSQKETWGSVNPQELPEREALLDAELGALRAAQEREVIFAEIHTKTLCGSHSKRRARL